MNERTGPWSDRLEKALCLAAIGHRGQDRRVTSVPYVEHVVAVAWILDRAGFDEDTVVAGLLHDLVEDTPTTLADLREQFGETVAALVDQCSEVKVDTEGRKRPWIDRKRDHLAVAAQASDQAKAILLADKLHNLTSIAIDLKAGRPVWDSFNGTREQVLWYYQAMIAASSTGSEDARLLALADQCRAVLSEISAPEPPEESGYGCHETTMC